MNTLEIEPYILGEHRLFAPVSYLMDRAVPAHEEIVLPEKVVEGGRMRFGFGAFPAAADHRGRRDRLMRPVRKSLRPDGENVIDMRERQPQNWAHFLNNHLSVLSTTAKLLELDLAELTVVLPANTPGYITEVAAMVGVSVIATDDLLDGTGVLFDLEPWNALRAVRGEWVPRKEIDAALQAAPAGPRPPRKVFVARRTTRAIENEAEVEAFLSERGYAKIYPEDLKPADQFRLFREATDVVAVHGAGLAPLPYAQKPPGSARLVEIMPCGHMADYYRIMAQQTGWRWAGVRGRIKRRYLPHIYAEAGLFDRFSLDSFSVDTVALEKALDSLA